MRRPFISKVVDERGAILIQVAVSMLGLLAFCSLVIDYGVFWASRRQAQNSADAGALAGAISLSFDDPTDFSDTGPAKQSAHAAALANKVFGEAVSNNVSTDVTFPACPDGSPAKCVRVDVYRTVARSNPLPTFFSHLMGIVSQDVSATATAKILSGTSVTCMRPFAVMDKWDEYDSSHAEHNYDLDPVNHYDPDFDPITSSFDKYPYASMKTTQEDDYYVDAVNCDPNDTTCTPVPGTGWRPFAADGVTPIDYGRQIEVHTGAQDQNSAGFFQPVSLKPGDTANDYCPEITTCDPSQSNFIGQVLQVLPGNREGPTNKCLFTDSNSLASQDPNAKWVVDADHPNGAVVSPLYADNASPRIVPLPVVSPEDFYNPANYTSGPKGPVGRTAPLTIKNILGFFIEDQINTGGLKVTRGRLINVPADDIGGSTVSDSSFLQKIVLIR